jgi:hypothetical protein
MIVPARTAPVALLLGMVTCLACRKEGEPPLQHADLEFAPEIAEKVSAQPLEPVQQATGQPPKEPTWASADQAAKLALEAMSQAMDPVTVQLSPGICHVERYHISSWPQWNCGVQVCGEGKCFTTYGLVLPDRVQFIQLGGCDPNTRYGIEISAKRALRLARSRWTRDGVTSETIARDMDLDFVCDHGGFLWTTGFFAASKSGDELDVGATVSATTGNFFEYWVTPTGRLANPQDPLVDPAQESQPHK